MIILISLELVILLITGVGCRTVEHDTGHEVAELSSLNLDDSPAPTAYSRVLAAVDRTELTEMNANSGDILLGNRDIQLVIPGIPASKTAEEWMPVTARLRLRTAAKTWTKSHDLPLHLRRNWPGSIARIQLEAIIPQRTRNAISAMPTWSSLCVSLDSLTKKNLSGYFSRYWQPHYICN